MSYPQNLSTLSPNEIASEPLLDPPVQGEAGAILIRADGLMVINLDDPAAGSEPSLLVQIKINDQHWAILPATRRAENPQAWEVVCSVPQYLKSDVMAVECVDHLRGRSLLVREIPTPPPLANSYGLLASDVQEVASHPLFSVPWMEFDGATLTITGAHLPPHGDPSLLFVEFDEGVCGSFDYPLPSPEFGQHYWYWPNGHHSGFMVRINLPASVAGANAFSFKFGTKKPARTAVVKEMPFSLSAGWQDRSRVWIPSDLKSYTGFPTDITQMSRVQTWSNHRTVAFTGYSAFKGFESLAARYGVTPKSGMTVLDWGCGHGRLTRHFIENWPEAKIFGADIDAENIEGCRQHLPGGEFHVAPLWPPMDFPAHSFDLIVGLSVMTHLTADAQEAWIAEINRILKPGGVALITFGGNGAATYASVHHGPEWWRNWVEIGFDDELVDTALSGKISDESYYRVTHQSSRRARAIWSRFITVVGVESQAFGYQDVAILRAR